MTTGAGCYTEAAVSSTGVRDEQLVMNAASRLNKQICQTDTVPWLPYVAELEKEENVCGLLLQLLTCMKTPGRKGIIRSPKTLSFFSLIAQFVTGHRTTKSINLNMHLYGLTRNGTNRCIPQTRLGISYADVLLLHDAWAAHDLQLSSICPHELAMGKPGITIVDNDDFNNGTLTSAGTSHHTNVMYIQEESLEVLHRDASEWETDAKQLSQILEDLANEVRHVESHETTQKQAEPPVREERDHDSSTETQTIRSVIHVLARSSDKGDRPSPPDQVVPAYAGFQANILPQSRRIRLTFV